jgi:hypothetical protein
LPIFPFGIIESSIAPDVLVCQKGAMLDEILDSFQMAFTGSYLQTRSPLLVEVVQVRLHYYQSLNLLQVVLLTRD